MPHISNDVTIDHINVNFISSELPTVPDVVIEDIFKVYEDRVEVDQCLANKLTSTGQMHILNAGLASAFEFDINAESLTTTGISSGNYTGSGSIVGSGDVQATTSEILCQRPSLQSYPDNYATITFAPVTLSSGKMTGGIISGGSGIISFASDNATILKKGFYVIMMEAINFSNSSATGVAGIGIYRNSVVYLIHNLIKQRTSTFNDPHIAANFVDILDVGDLLEFYTFGTAGLYTNATVSTKIYRIE